MRHGGAVIAASSVRRAIRIGLGTLVGVGFAGVVAAQGATMTGHSAFDPVEAGKAVTVVLTQTKVVTDAQGKETRGEASAVKPGDVLEYTATYTNNTGKAVAGLVADLPIPEGVAYMPRTAKPGSTLVKAATADGRFGAEPLMRQIEGKQVAVPYGDYRTLRWTLGQLPAKGVAAVSARVKVESVVPAVPFTAPASAEGGAARAAH